MTEQLTTRRFPGGIHPSDAEKPRTRALAVEAVPAPAKAVVLLQQHIGAPAVPVVEKGDEVARGQVIAEAGGFVSVPYHSPVSGKVVSRLPNPEPRSLSKCSIPFSGEMVRMPWRPSCSPTLRSAAAPISDHAPQLMLSDGNPRWRR